MLFPWHTALAMCDHEFIPSHRQHEFKVHPSCLPIPSNPISNLDDMSKLPPFSSFPFNISLLLSICLKLSSSAPLLWLFLIQLESQPIQLRFCWQWGLVERAYTLAFYPQKHFGLQSIPFDLGQVTKFLISSLTKWR